MSSIKTGDRVRWKPFSEEKGLVGHEGTVVAVHANGWGWVVYDDGTEKDAYFSELEKMES